MSPSSSITWLDDGERLTALRMGTSLWSNVRLKCSGARGRDQQSAYRLTGRQQQRLCISRTIAVRPDVILMDEPCSSLDRTAFFTANVDEWSSDRTGVLVEYGKTSKIFEKPSDQRTEDYITGRFG